MHEYRAKLDRVIDGDTVVLDIDLGFSAWVKVTLRLEGIEARYLPRGVIAVRA